MATPTSIGPQVLYLSNPESLNELYDQLRADEYQTKIEPRTEPVVIQTLAGEMQLSRAEAGRLHLELKKLDAEDNPKRQENGWIDGSAVQEYLKRQGQFHDMGGLQPDFGVRVAFESFTPNALWRSNYPLILAAHQRHELVYDSDPSPITDDDLWRATTLATLSGIDPDVIAGVKSLCQPQDDCSLFMNIHYRGVTAMHNEFQLRDKRVHLTIHWNLSTSTDGTMARAYTIHEHAHKIYVAAMLAGHHATFADLIIGWGKKHEKYAAAVATFQRFFISHPELQGFLSGSVLQEAADPAFFGWADPASLPFRRKNDEEDLRDMTRGAQTDYNHSWRAWTGKPHKLAAKLALATHRTERYGINPALIRAHRAKAGSLLKTLGPEAERTYTTVYNMLGVVDAYARSDEFRSFARPLLPSPLRAE